jgi:uncharacterized protein (TIGR02598 family)
MAESSGPTMENRSSCSKTVLRSIATRPKALRKNNKKTIDFWFVLRDGLPWSMCPLASPESANPSSSTSEPTAIMNKAPQSVSRQNGQSACVRLGAAGLALSRRGFTLVEVVLSIGIVAFAFTSLLALVPAGLQVFRQAMDLSLSSQIVQRVVSDARQTEWEVLVGNGSTQPDRFFDDQGNEVTRNDPFTYHVRVNVTPGTVLPTGSPSNSNLATIIIKIVQNPGRVADPFTSPQQHQILQFSALLAGNS